MNKLKCSMCKIEKDKEMFHVDRRNKRGWKPYCKPCGVYAVKKWKTTEKAKNWQEQYKLKKYGLTKDQYLNMLEKQKGACAICCLPRFRQNEKVLHIDHCHKTGKVRGLLCSMCNTTLGKFEKLQDKILKYLEDSKV